jgi:hypothetical protein
MYASDICSVLSGNKVTANPDGWISIIYSLSERKHNKLLTACEL